jgi:large subunit ribosomal protein L9
MKVILNKDLSPLGEEGDVKEVAKGYARNYLFPRGIAVPYTDRTVKLFESRKEDIEARKAAKRQDAAGMKDKLEALEVLIIMPAGANGRLYGAVTAQLVSDELAKLGYPTERKRIELPGSNFKSVGKYKATVKLYESAAAEITVVVQAQEIKTETRAAAPARRGRRRFEETATVTAEGGEASASDSAVDYADAEITVEASTDAASDTSAGGEVTAEAPETDTAE